MGPIKLAIGDMVITFMWVFLSSTFGLLSSFIASAIGVQTVAWAPIVIITFIISVSVLIFTIIAEFLGGASFNPTGNASFYAAGVGDDSLISMALRFPAQVRILLLFFLDGILSDLTFFVSVWINPFHFFFGLILLIF